MLINMPSTLIHIPTHLIIEQRTTPLSLGIYTLIGRLFLFKQESVDLSQPDIMKYDASIDRNSVMRAIAKLIKNNWMVQEREGVGGNKNTYRPTWGFVAGRCISWDTKDTAPPEGMQSVQMSSQVLDQFIGVMVPNTSGAALIERHHAKPLLRLADIGVYLTALVGYPVSTPNLTKLKLVINGRAQIGQ
jgi:hypothetical protein